VHVDGGKKEREGCSGGKVDEKVNQEGRVWGKRVFTESASVWDRGRSVIHA